MGQFEIPAPVRTVLFLLNQAEYEAYLVGGCVRDMLLLRKPDDYDICTTALPAEVQRVFGTGEYSVITTGILHGTVTVIISSMPVEITTYRTDGMYSDGRRPDTVSFVHSLEEDLARRDFTVNALAYHPDVGLVDFHGGQVDLEAKRIRAVGVPENRFEEDALRILRMYRFAAVLGFEVEEETATAASAKRDGLDHIAAERIAPELSKLLMAARPSSVIRQMLHAGVFEKIVPEFIETVGFEQNNSYHDATVDEHTLRVLDNAPAILIMRLAALFHDIGKPRVYSESEDGRGHFYAHQFASEEIAAARLRVLRYPKSVIKEVCTLIHYHDNFLSGDARQMRRMVSKIGYEMTEKLLDIQYADACGKSDLRRESSHKEIQKARVTLAKQRAEQPAMCVRELAVNGHDLIASFHIREGKQVGEALQKLLERVIDGAIQNEKETLLSYFEKEFFASCKKDEANSD